MGAARKHQLIAPRPRDAVRGAWLDQAALDGLTRRNSLRDCCVRVPGRPPPVQANWWPPFAQGEFARSTDSGPRQKRHKRPKAGSGRKFGRFRRFCRTPRPGIPSRRIFSPAQPSRAALPSLCSLRPSAEPLPWPSVRWTTSKRPRRRRSALYPSCRRPCRPSGHRSTFRCSSAAACSARPHRRAPHGIKLNALPAQAAGLEQGELEPVAVHASLLVPV